jgi:hypothetical protein
LVESRHFELGFAEFQAMRLDPWGSWTREPFGALLAYGQDSRILLALYEPAGVTT